MNLLTFLSAVDCSSLKAIVEVSDKTKDTTYLDELISLQKKLKSTRSSIKELKDFYPKVSESIKILKSLDTEIVKVDYFYCDNIHVSLHNNNVIINNLVKDLLYLISELKDKKPDEEYLKNYVRLNKIQDIIDETTKKADTKLEPDLFELIVYLNELQSKILKLILEQA